MNTIKSLRIRLNLSQGEYAKRYLGLSRRTVQNWELETTQPDLAGLRLVEALDFIERNGLLKQWVQERDKLSATTPSGSSE